MKKEKIKNEVSYLNTYKKYIKKFNDYPEIALED